MSLAADSKRDERISFYGRKNVTFWITPRDFPLHGFPRLGLMQMFGNRAWMLNYRSGKPHRRKGLRGTRGMGGTRGNVLLLFRKRAQRRA
jgi:hypothetical protein